MDPASAFGVVSGAFQVVHLITQTAAGLWSLRDKYTHADLTIRSLVGELTTIKSAITQLDDWDRLNRARVSAEYNEYDEGLNVALDGCRVIMDVLFEEVVTLTRGATGQDTSLGFSTRVKVIWNEDVMRGHQDRLRSQVVALQLLLQACQCRSSSEQIALLRQVDSRRIIRKVAEDTATLRTSSSYAGSRADTASISNHQPSIMGDTVFDFDRTVAASVPYRRVFQPSRAGTETPSVISGGNQSSRITDEGYGSGVLTSDTPATSQTSILALPVRPHESINNGHSKSVTFRPDSLQPNQTGVRRWKSESTSSSVPVRGSGSKREKIRSALRQLSRSNSVLSPSQSLRSPSEGSWSGRQSHKRRDASVSIDFTSIEGSSAPDIVKAAQSGSRDDVERLIANGHDIESRHIHTRRNALLVASHCGNAAVVDLLILKNARLSVTDVSGSTALHLAASRGHCDVIELLLCENFDMEAKTSSGRTALWVAAEQGQLDAARLLIANDAKVNARANNQMTPLHATAKAGDTDIIELLLSCKADMEAKDGQMMTALHYACEEGRQEAAELLLNNKAKVDSVGSDRRTPLICAAAMGQLGTTQLLLKRKASDRHADDASMTALHWAAFNGHTEVVDILSQKKDAVSITNIAGRTALHLAVMKSRFAVVELLLRRNISIETRCQSGMAALHYACMANNIEIAKLLLLSGANIEVQAEDQRRPIHIAAACGSMAVLNLLCNKGASLEARDALGDRALCTACRHGHAAAVQNLLDRGSPLYLPYESRAQEDSPLCLAAMGGHLPAVNLLLERGASVMKRNDVGWPPYYYAMHHGHPEVLRVLLQHNPAELARENLDLSQAMKTIGFSPSRSISEERKREVHSLLGQAHRFADISGVVTSRPNPWLREHEPPHQPKPFSLAMPSLFQSTPEPTNTHPALGPTQSSSPQELPGTLEQGLPPSRSRTPEQMLNGGIRANATATSVPVGRPLQPETMMEGSASWTNQPIAMPTAQRPGMSDPVSEGAPNNALPSTVFQLLEEWTQGRSTVSPVSAVNGEPSQHPVETSLARLRLDRGNASKSRLHTAGSGEAEFSDADSAISTYTAPEEASP